MKLNKLLITGLALVVTQLSMTPTLEARNGPPSAHHHHHHQAIKVPREVIELEKHTDYIAKSYRNEIHRRPGRPSEQATKLSRLLFTLAERSKTLSKQIRQREHARHIDKTLHELKNLSTRVKGDSRDLAMDDRTRKMLLETDRLIRKIESNKRSWVTPPPHGPKPKGKH